MPLCCLLNVNLLFTCRLILIVSFSRFAVPPVNSSSCYYSGHPGRAILSSSLSPVHRYPVSHQEPTDLLLKCLGMGPSDSNLKTLLFIQVESTGSIKAINSALMDKGLDTHLLITSAANQNFP